MPVRGINKPIPLKREKGVVCRTTPMREYCRSLPPGCSGKGKKYTSHARRTAEGFFTANWRHVLKEGKPENFLHARDLFVNEPSWGARQPRPCEASKDNDVLHHVIRVFCFSIGESPSGLWFFLVYLKSTTRQIFVGRGL